MKNYKCIICSTVFIRNSNSEVCSLKCRLLENSFVDYSGCWIWIGANANYYGKVSWKSKTLLAHRASYQVFKGNIPVGFNVCHTCDNPKCINPYHLWIGSQKQNILDSVKKNRFSHPASIKQKKQLSQRMKGNKLGEINKGSNHPLNKLFDNDIYEIRRLLKEGVPQKKIAEVFNIHPSAVSYIKNKKRWTHLK